MDAETLLLETEESMLKAVDFAKQEFSGVRTGKASPGLVENLDVHVSSYGSVMKLKGLAVISTPEPRLILIQPFDPSTVHDIGRAINESKLNLNPLVEGRSIRLPIPAHGRTPQRPCEPWTNPRRKKPACACAAPGRPPWIPPKSSRRKTLSRKTASATWKRRSRS